MDLKQRPRRHLNVPGVIFLLCIIIAAVLIGDFLVKLVRKPVTNYVIVNGTFATDSQADTAAGGDSAQNQANPTTTQPATDASDPNSIVVTLTTSDMGNGSLILVNDAHPYTGTATLSSLSDLASDSFKIGSTDLSIQEEAKAPLQQMMSAYTAYNGSCNLQISGTTTNGNFYSTVFPDRNSGYGFDIGLITSTGEVVQYLTKRNEWMVSNCYQYGFILRYPDDKTEQTGVAYMPHHFRYVGAVHAAIMNENQYCLEEYLTALKSYSESAPLTYTLSGTAYSIYYVPMDASGTTTLSISKETPNYTISGNNMDGFIVTIAATAAGTSEQTNATDSAAP